MKKILTLLLALATFAELAEAKYIKPYYRKDGTLVQGSLRTTPNKSKFDNYSAKGMINPYSGQKGYKKAFYPSSKIKAVKPFKVRKK